MKIGAADHLDGPVSPTQTPLFNKLTLSHRNSNHSKECFPSSKSGPQGVLWCPPNCPWIAPWSPRVPNCAPSLPNNRFRAPKVIASVSKIWKLTSRNKRASTHFSREMKQRITKNQTSLEQGPAAVGEALKIRRTSVRGSRACWI